MTYDSSLFGLGKVSFFPLVSFDCLSSVDSVLSKGRRELFLDSIVKLVEPSLVPSKDSTMSVSTRCGQNTAIICKVLLLLLLQNVCHIHQCK